MGYECKESCPWKSDNVEIVAVDLSYKQCPKTLVKRKGKMRSRIRLEQGGLYLDSKPAGAV